MVIQIDTETTPGQAAATGVTLTFLGTGTSTGVPVIGCDCGVCQSADPRDRRLRSSVLVETGGATLLVDTSPDVREQMLRTGTRRIDGILYTHAHADHTAGLDELRRFNAMQQRRIPAWASGATGADISQRFAYAFDHSFRYFGGKPDLDLNDFIPGDIVHVAGIKVQTIPLMHGTLPIVGYRFGDLAYLTDVKTIPDESWPLLEGLDVLVLTSLRQEPHAAHMHLGEALEVVERLSPRRAYLTHLAHEMGKYADVSPNLPPTVELALDGMTIRATPT